MNQVDRIIAFETGELDDESIIELFQELIDSGLAWQLQGSYGRTARSLIEAGLVYSANDPNRPVIIDAKATDIELPALGPGR